MDGPDQDDEHAIQQSPGIECPHCGCAESRVLKSRHYRVRVYTTRETISKTVRYRECQHCGRRFRTTERLDTQRR